MSTVLTIGDLKSVVSFEKVSKSSDGTGGQREAYDFWFATKAKMKRISGFRSFQSGYDQSVTRYEMWCYWRSELENFVSKDARIVFVNRIFGIDVFDIVDDARRIFRFELTEIR